MQPSAASLSVIVPVLDEEEHLPRLLRSLAEGGVAADEVLVVDGGSRDRTPHLAEEHGARVVGAPRGRGPQLAAGARLARGELLVFLHADMRLAPDTLEAVRLAFAERDLVAGGMRQRIDHPARIYRAIERAADRRVGRGLVYGDSGLCVRRTAYEEVGGFRDDLPFFEDLDLSRRLRRHGRVELLRDARLTLSPRRWEHAGAVRQTLRNWALTCAFAAGVHPRRLARFYPARTSRAGAPRG